MFPPGVWSSRNITAPIKFCGILLGKPLLRVCLNRSREDIFKFSMDNGYILWSFQGRQIYQQSFETFYQFLWRPRETLLSKSQVNKVRKDLKKYEKEFDKADKVRERALYLEETKGKRAERKKYRDLRSELRALRNEQRPRRIELLDGYDSEDDSNYVIKEITIETILSTKEEVVA